MPDTAAAEPAKIDAWWFAARDRLPHGDGRKIVIGESHSVPGKIVLCQNALHASRDPFDALYHAAGPMLYRVRCWGDVVEKADQLGARHREYLAVRDATEMLRRWARERALSVIHRWDAPEIVRRYLETGDETVAAAAELAWATATPPWSEAAAAAAGTMAVRAGAAEAAGRARFGELVADLFSEDAP